jgi:hypothetical protein
MKAKELMSLLALTVEKIRYKDWTFHLRERHNVPYLQVSFPALDAETGLGSMQAGRMWMLSAEMTASQVLQTALMAVLAAEEHEAREAFTYRGVGIFNPHLDFAAMAEATQSQFDLNEDRLLAIQALDPLYDLM